MPNNQGSFHQLWRRLKSQWIADSISDDIALCEFDCRKSQCRYDEWASCERRITKAAGELMPAARPAPGGRAPAPGTEQ